MEDTTNKSLEERIEDATESASEVFWRVIAKHFPEITTGDASVDEVLAWENAAKTAVRKWYEGNKPKTVTE